MQSCGVGDDEIRPNELGYGEYNEKQSHQYFLEALEDYRSGGVKKE